MLLTGDRSATVCSGDVCTESDCCVDEPSEVALEVNLDCASMTQDQVDQSIVILKQQVSDETGLSVDDFTIELCNTEARRRRRAATASADFSATLMRGRVWNLDGSKSRSRRAETTTMTIKIDPSLSTSAISDARDVLVNEEDENPNPIDIIAIDEDSGNVTLTGNLSYTTTITTTTPKGTVAPTEAIVERPTTTRFAIGLRPPYVRKNSNAEEYLDGMLRLIPVTGQVQDKRPDFDLNFNHQPGEGMLTFNDLAVSLSGDPNVLAGTELAPYGQAQLQTKTITDLITICQRIANSTGLVNPGQIDTACAIQNLEVAVRYKQPECEVLEQIEVMRESDSSIASGWTTCSSSPSTCPYGDFSLLIAMIAFRFDSKFTKGSGNAEKVANYDALERLLRELRTEFPLYSVVQANVEYGTAINEQLAVSGAIWGVITSLALVFIAVVMFKAHVKLTVIVTLMIFANLGLVVGMFNVIGWTLGGIEAVALSILIGTGVDYCIHMLEGFLETHPEHMDGHSKRILEAKLAGLDKNGKRDKRTAVAITTIGVPILSAAITTGVCGLVLSFCGLMMFKRFGEIILINTVSSIILTLSLLPALLAAFGPHSYHHTAKMSVVGVLIVGLIFGGIALILFFVAKGGNCIVGPSGYYLFDSDKCEAL
jgi:hypothetical protein